MNDMYEFSTEELGTGRFVDYETIPYKIDTVVESGDLVLTPLNHDWKPEGANISEIKPIRITEPFLLANGWQFDVKYKMFYADDDKRFVFKQYDMRFVLYLNSGYFSIDHQQLKKPVLYIHELQNIMVATGLSIKEMKFLPEFYFNDQD